VSQEESIIEEVPEIQEIALEESDPQTDYEFSAKKLNEHRLYKFTQRALPKKVSNTKLSFPFSYNFEESIFEENTCVSSCKQAVSLSEIRKSIKKQGAKNRVRVTKRVTKKPKNSLPVPVSILDKIYDFPSYSNSSCLFESVQKVLRAYSKSNKLYGKIMSNFRIVTD
jgi:hypothetical protein